MPSGPPCISAKRYKGLSRYRSMVSRNVRADSMNLNRMGILLAFILPACRAGCHRKGPRAASSHEPTSYNSVLLLPPRNAQQPVLSITWRRFLIDKTGCLAKVGVKTHQGKDAVTRTQRQFLHFLGRLPHCLTIIQNLLDILAPCRVESSSRLIFQYLSHRRLRAFYSRR